MIHPNRFKIGQLVSGAIHEQPFAGLVISRGVDAHGGYADGPHAELTHVTVATSTLMATPGGRQVDKVLLRGEAEIGGLIDIPADDNVMYSATIHFTDGNTRRNAAADAAETVAWLGRYAVTWSPVMEPVFHGDHRDHVESVHIEQLAV
jgi:hypothetical protein